MGSNTSDNSGIIPPALLYIIDIFFFYFSRSLKVGFQPRLRRRKRLWFVMPRCEKCCSCHAGTRRAVERRWTLWEGEEGGGGREGKTISKGRAFGYLWWEGRTERAEIQSSCRPRSDALIEEAAAARQINPPPPLPLPFWDKHTWTNIHCLDHNGSFMSLSRFLVLLIRMWMSKHSSFVKGEQYYYYSCIVFLFFFFFWGGFHISFSCRNETCVKVQQKSAFKLLSASNTVTLLRD